MKKNNFLLAVIITALGFVSCKKENVPSPENQATAFAANERLLLSHTATQSSSQVITYNPDKTIKSYTWGNGAAKAEFTYLPNKLVITLSANNVKYSEQVYDMSGGFAQQLTNTHFDANGAVLDVYLTKYSYNANKQLVKYEFAKNGSNIGSIERSYDANGDMVFSVTKNANGIITRTATYEYDLSLLEKSGSFSQFDSNGTGLIFPKYSKHMIKKMIIVENNTTTILHFSYTTDAMGYVVTGVIKNDQNIVQDSYTNTWQ